MSADSWLALMEGRTAGSADCMRIVPWLSGRMK
jgi:hypothetical protein